MEVPLNGFGDKTGLSLPDDESLSLDLNPIDYDIFYSPGLFVARSSDLFVPPRLTMRC